MKRKTRMGTVLAGALTLTGCAVFPYEYQDVINEEFIEFRSGSLFWLLKYNRLLIRKPDGRIIIYLDDDRNDLRLDYISITDASYKPIYQGRSDKEVLEVAQIVFDDYLKLIKEAKSKEDFEKQMKEAKRLEGILKILKQ